MRNQTDERSARGGGDGSSVNNLDEFQISSPLSSFRKSTSNPRLIRRPIKTQYLPELNKNCNHPTTLTEQEHSGLDVVYKTEDDDWYAGEEGDYFDCQPSTGDVTNCMSNSSIYAKDDHQDSITFYSEEANSSMPSMPFFQGNGAASQCDGGEMIDGINQLLADKCNNGAYAYRGPLGHRDEPMGVMLMSYTDPNALEDDMASGSRIGDAGFPLSLREPEGPAGDACEVVIEDIESDEDEESDDEVESNDEKEEAEETIDVCETKENVCSDAESSDIESEEDSGEEEKETVIERQPRHIKNVLPVHAIPDMCAGSVANALSLRGTVEMMEEDDDDEDDDEEGDEEVVPSQYSKQEAPSMKPYDEDAELKLNQGKRSVLVPCNDDERSQIPSVAPTSKDTDTKNNFLEKYATKVWDTSVQTMKSVTRSVTDSLSNSSLDDDETEENEEEEEIERSTGVTQKQLALLQGPCEPEIPMQESNTPNSYVSKPQRSYTLLKAKPVKDAAFKKLGQNLLKQSQLKQDDSDDRNAKMQPVRNTQVNTHQKAPVIRPKGLAFGERPQYHRKINERTAMLENKLEPTIIESSGPKSKNLSKSVSNDRVFQYNAKSNSKRSPNDTKTHDKESSEPMKQINFADNSEKPRRVNVAALLSSQAKASMRMSDKTMMVAKSETTLRDEKAAPKKTKSSYFGHEKTNSQRTRDHRNKDKDYNNYDNDMTGFPKSPFSQLGIPTEGATKTYPKSQKYPKESGSSVDPDSGVLKLKAPSDTLMSKFSQTAKQTAVRRTQKWRPATGSASKQLIRLNENANKPSTEQSAIETSNPGPSIDLSTERAESNMSSASRIEKERHRKKMMAFRTESSNGVAKVYCVGAPEETQSENSRGPVQQVKMYHTQMPKIHMPTIIPEPPKAWYNPQRWFGAGTPSPVVEMVADSSDKQKKRTPSAGPRHVNKVKPKHPALMNADTTSKPEGEEEKQKTDGKSLAVEAKHEPSATSQRSDTKAQRPKSRRTPTNLVGYNQESNHDQSSTVSNPCQTNVKDAWKSDADRLKQERKERLHLLQTKRQGFVEEEEPVPEKAAGAGFSRFNRSRAYRPQNMSNGGGHGGEHSPIPEPTQPYRPRPVRSSFQRRNQGENTNGNAIEEKNDEHSTEITTSVDAADYDANNNSSSTFVTSNKLAQSYEDGYAINATLELLVE